MLFRYVQYQHQYITGVKLKVAPINSYFDKSNTNISTRQVKLQPKYNYISTIYMQCMAQEVALAVSTIQWCIRKVWHTLHMRHTVVLQYSGP